MIILPSSIIEIVDSKLNEFRKGLQRNTIRSNCLRFCEDLIYHMHLYGKGIFPYPVNYRKQDLRKKYGRSIDKSLKFLEKEGILKINHSYCNRSHTKAYLIESDLLTGDMTKVVLAIANQESTDPTNTFLSKLEMDLDLGGELINDYIEEDYFLLREVKIDLEITEEHFSQVRVYSLKTDNPFHQFRTLRNISKEKLLEKFSDPSFSLIWSNSKAFYMPLEVFVDLKKKALRNHYLLCLERFKQQAFSSIKYDRNGRLHHTLTNFPKVLLPALSFNGFPLVEIDLASSQFTLLAYALRNPNLDNRISKFSNEIDFDCEQEDFRLFCKLTSTGTLYEYVMNHFDLADRNSAKEYLFTIIFGTKDRNTDEAPIHVLFPSINHFAFLFKENANDYRVLSNTLQRIESSIFIERILKTFREEDIPICSKHDSFIFPECFSTQVLDSIGYQLDTLLGINTYLLKLNTYAPLGTPSP